MKLNRLLLGSCFALVCICRADTRPVVYPLFDYCKSYYNPAFTADNGKLSFYSLGSYDPTGYYMMGPGPASVPEINLTSDISVPVLTTERHRIGAGLTYTRQDYNFFNAGTGRLNISYHYLLSPEKKLMLGGNLERARTVINIPMARPDPITMRSTFGDAGFGIGYSSSHRNFYSGIAVNHVLQPMLINEFTGAVYDRYFSYGTLMAGIDMNKGSRFIVKPSILAHYDGIIYALTNLTVEYKKWLNAGMVYNSLTDEGGFRLGTHGRNITIQYCHMLYLGYYMHVRRGTHIFSVNISLPSKQ